MGNVFDMTKNDVSHFPKDYNPHTDPRNHRWVNGKEVKANRNQYELNQIAASEKCKEEYINHCLRESYHEHRREACELGAEYHCAWT